MTKMQFLLALNDKLAGLPRNEVEERLNFYSEMIEDRMEEGLVEEDAVAAVGSVDEIAEQITAEIPLTKIVKEKIQSKRRMKAWEITLLSVGGLVWVPLLIAAVVVVLSLYVSLWAVIVSLWAAFGSLTISALVVVIFGVVFALSGNAYVGLVVVAAGLVCAGLAILLFYGCMAATKGAAFLVKKMVLAVKKEAAQ